jgi:hypothetical protein
VSLKPPQAKYHWWWLGGFIAVGLIGIVLTAVLARMGSEAQRINERTQDGMRVDLKDAKDKMDRSLIAQADMNGQLKGLQLALGNMLGMKEVAAAIGQMVQANAQNASDLKASSSEMCERAHSWAGKVRIFQYQYDTSERAIEEKSWQLERAAKTDEERHRVTDEENHQTISSYQAHAQAFGANYVPEAKYLRDLLIDRVPPNAREMLRRNNAQADGNLATSMMAGAAAEYSIANYLDELANAVCPLTAEQKKAKQATYHTVKARLHGFEVQGNKFHEKCGPTSTNPPDSTEVGEWITKANAYVRNSSIEEYLKNEFESVGPADNSIYVGVTPACATLNGKITDKNSQIISLEHYLGSQ